LNVTISEKSTCSVSESGPAYYLIGIADVEDLRVEAVVVELALGALEPVEPLGLKLLRLLHAPLRLRMDHLEVNVGTRPDALLSSTGERGLTIAWVGEKADS
jgi:hypothetical protein